MAQPLRLRRYRGKKTTSNVAKVDSSLCWICEEKKCCFSQLFLSTEENNTEISRTFYVYFVCACCFSGKVNHHKPLRIFVVRTLHLFLPHQLSCPIESIKGFQTFFSCVLKPKRVSRFVYLSRLWETLRGNYREPQNNGQYFGTIKFYDMHRKQSSPGCRLKIIWTARIIVANDGEIDKMCKNVLWNLLNYKNA